MHRDGHVEEEQSTRVWHARITHAAKGVTLPQAHWDAESLLNSVQNCEHTHTWHAGQLTLGSAMAAGGRYADLDSSTLN